MALALVADLRDGDAAGAGVDVGRAVLLARVVEVAGFGGVQAVVLLGGRRFRWKRRRRSRRYEEFFDEHYCLAVGLVWDKMCEALPHWSMMIYCQVS